MKKENLYISNLLTAFGLVFFLLLFIASCNSKPNDQDHNGKHPTGKDSITGMDKNSGITDHQQMEAVKDKPKGKKKMKQGKDSADETFWNTLPANQTVISKQAAVPLGNSSQQFTINGNGYVTFDLRRNRKIPVRIGGRIERLYVKYNYQYVRKGEKIMELYSPELNTYVSEYLYIQRKSMDTLLMAKAKQKLLLLGLTRNQILKIDQSGEAPFTITIYSPFEGYVLFNPSASAGGMGTQNTQSGMGNGMNNLAASASTDIPGTTLSDNTIREGIYVSKDQTVFWINDFREVWGIVAFSHQNEKILKPGLEVIMKSELFPDQTFRSDISMVEPVYTSGQKFTQVRIYLSNAKRKLKQNSLITATVSVNSQAIMVPASSVYYLGNTAIVWVQKAVTKQGSNIFQARAVKTGNRNNQNIEVLKGLNRGEFIAKDAGYLADSETIIQY